MSQTCSVRVTVNGALHGAEVEPRLLLADFIRHHLYLTGTHIGCEVYPHKAGQIAIDRVR